MSETTAERQDLLRLIDAHVDRKLKDAKPALLAEVMAELDRALSESSDEGGNAGPARARSWDLERSCTDEEVRGANRLYDVMSAEVRGIGIGLPAGYTSRSVALASRWLESYVAKKEQS